MGLTRGSADLTTLAVATSLNSSDSVSKLYAESLVLIFLQRLGSWQQHSGMTHRTKCERLPQVLEFINCNIEMKLSIRRLAQIAQTSPFHFARQFKASMGVTPHQYVLEKRVEKAKQLLADASRAIAEISNDCGFASQAHLTTVFQRQLGITPNAYRAYAISIGASGARFDKKLAAI